MLNTVMLIGNVGADPALQQVSSNTAMCKLRIATTERWTAADGTAHERTEWHTVTCWRRLAESAARYLKKGALVYVEGALHYSKWTDETGAVRYGCEVNASRIRFLDKRPDGAAAPEEVTDHAHA